MKAQMTKMAVQPAPAMRSKMQIKKANSKIVFILLFMTFFVTGCSKGNFNASYIGEDYGVKPNEALVAAKNAMYDGFVDRRFIKIGEELIPIESAVGRNGYREDGFVKDESTGYLTYSPDGEKKCKLGIDVSRHNGEINWELVKSSGISFAFIRLGYRGYGTGKMGKDENYDINMAGATASGIPKGVYFYSQAISYEEGVEEANFVLSNLEGYTLQYPVVYDTEDAENADARTNNMTPMEHTDAAKGFCDTIQAAGHEVMIYANKNWFVKNLEVVALKDYPWWLAQYAEKPSFPYRFKIWQYSAKGKVPGIKGKTDMNIEFLDDLEEVLPISE